jgi:hypothetical protein
MLKIPWRLQANGQESPVYSSEQLKLFEAVLNDALEDLRAAKNPPVAQEEEEQTKRQLASVIFRAAAAGERDYLWLKTKALQSLS